MPVRRPFQKCVLCTASDLQFSGYGKISKNVSWHTNFEWTPPQKEVCLSLSQAYTGGSDVLLQLDYLSDAFKVTCTRTIFQRIWSLTTIMDYSWMDGKRSNMTCGNWLAIKCEESTPALLRPAGVLQDFAFVRSGRKWLQLDKMKTYAWCLIF